MFKYIYASLLLLLCSSTYGNNCEIPMRIIVEEGFSNITSETVSVLENQLKRLATQSGLDISNNNSKFAITVKLDILDRHIIDGAPVQISNVYGATIYIADIFESKLFSSAYVEIKGVGTNETKASSNAIRRLNTKNKTIAKFMKDTKSQVVGYYDTQYPIILKQAKQKAFMKNYEEALAMLSVIPSCCNCYDSAINEAMEIYVLYRDSYFLAQFNKAKALWASNPTIDNSERVVEILAAIDPDAKCYNDAMSLLSEIAKSIKKDVDYETRKKYEDSVEIEKLRIRAIGEIGKAYAANQPKVNIGFLGL